MTWDNEYLNDFVDDLIAENSRKRKLLSQLGIISICFFGMLIILTMVLVSSERQTDDLLQYVNELETRVQIQDNLVKVTEELLDEVQRLRIENEGLRKQMEDWLNTWDIQDSSSLGNLSGAQREFISLVAPGAARNHRNYGVLPSVTMAQAILETGWGKSYLAKQGNLFGIKGAGTTVQTGEYSRGRYITISAQFRVYDCVTESITDHGQLLTKPRYALVLASDNYRDACKALQAAGYATDPNYAKKLINIIERYQLQDFDAGRLVSLGDKLYLVTRGGETHDERIIVALRGCRTLPV